MSVLLLRTDQVNRCPKHSLDAAHYGPDGCECLDIKGLTLKQKEKAALAFPCPLCKVSAGNACLHQNASRKMCWLKYPHPERVRLVDPDHKGKRGGRKYDRYRRREALAETWQQSGVRDKS